MESLNLLEIVEKPDWKTLLIELVKKEKMDVWAIDIGKLAESYLEYVKRISEENLKIPANIMLACSILLKLKASTIKIPKFEAEREEEIIELPELPELKPILRIKEATVSLEELIRVIDNVIEASKRKKHRKEEAKKVAEKVILEKMNIEKLTENIDEIYERIKRAAQRKGIVKFSEISKAKNTKEWISEFASLLFLHSQEKIYINQPVLFSEIYIALGVEK